MAQRPEPDTASDVLVVGGASTDFVAYGSRLPGPGEEETGEDFCQLCGGKGANQAVAVARLGGAVALIARVGKDCRGDAIIEYLRREGVKTRWCVRDSGEQTSAILLMIDRQGTKQTVTIPGATGRLSPEDVTQAQDLFRHTRLLLIQFEAPLPTVLAAIETAHRLGRPVLLDAAPPVQMPMDTWQQVDLIRMNAKEARVLTGVTVDNVDTARRAAQLVFERGARAAAIEAGRQGNLLIWQEGEVVLPVIPVKTVDKTGSGDAFIAALAVARLEGQPWTEAGWFASAAAALTSTRLGAEPALPKREDVLSLLTRIGRRVVQS